MSESIPVKDMRNIIDALTAHGKETKDASELTNLIRPKLGRQIVQPLLDSGGTLKVLTLTPDLEQLLENSKNNAQNDAMTLDPSLASSIIENLSQEVSKVQGDGWNIALVVSPALRPWMSKFVRARVPDLAVLSYTEIPDDQRIQVHASIGGEKAIESN